MIPISFRTALALVFLVLAVPAYPETQASQGRYVRSLLDFRIHMKAHIQRVELLALKAYELKPELFDGLSPQLIRDFMRLHDQSKVNQTPAFLRDHGLDNSKTILARLYENYGVDFSSISPERRAQFQALVGELNAVDAKVAKDFFHSRGLLEADGTLNERAQKLIRLEKIADSVDRGSCPVSAEEFNRPMLPSSRFMKDPVDQAIALQLEKQYDSIVSSATYEKVRSPGRSYRCPSMFSSIMPVTR